MKLEYWNGPNFGDQLNKYIFPKLFNDELADNGDDARLYCIGSIIDKRIPVDKPAVIFGTGVRDPIYCCNNNKWDIRFLRGPLSASCLSQPRNFITDSAYCLPLLSEYQSLKASAIKKYKLSIIPYFSYASKLPWGRICGLVGAHFIDPSNSPETVIKEIAASDRVLNP